MRGRFRSHYFFIRRLISFHPQMITPSATPKSAPSKILSIEVAVQAGALLRAGGVE